CGGLLWGGPELLSRIGLALALLRLEYVHGLANRGQHEHVRSSREGGTGVEHPQPQQQHTPTHPHRCSPLGVVVCAQAHQTAAPTNPRHHRRYNSRRGTPAASASMAIFTLARSIHVKVWSSE